MVIGFGLMLGFYFFENFNYFYLVVSIQDFWWCWYILFFSWLCDYFYIGLGGNCYGVWKIYCNLFLIMVIVGFWYGGDSWNYLLWGLVYGLVLCIDCVWLCFLLFFIFLWLVYGLMLLFVCLVWILFCVLDFVIVVMMYVGQFGLYGIGLSDVLVVMLWLVQVLVVLLGLFWIVVLLWQVVLEVCWGECVFYFWFVWVWLIVVFLFFFVLIVSCEIVFFFYFQF